MIAGMLKTLLAFNPFDDLAAVEVIAACTLLNIVPQRVCSGVINTFKVPLFGILRNPKSDASRICGIILGPDCGDFSDDWDISLPTTPKPAITSVPDPPPKSPMLKVLHITDIHLDHEYKKGVNPYCDEPLCCREQPQKSSKTERLSGKWGDYYYCDTPKRTFISMLDNIAKKHKIDLIYWTGDYAPHDWWNTTKEKTLQNINIINNHLKRTFPRIPIFPSIGNHDTDPVNLFSSSDAGESSMDWLYKAFLDSWGDWIPDKTVEPTIMKGGYYSVLFQEGFRIIAVNSNFCYILNFWLLIDSVDPSEQLAWLSKELEKAEAAGEKVHILSHIPPGCSDCLRTWSTNFNKIINRFEGTVLAQFYGHTHRDEFEIFYDENRRPTNVAYISPSVTTYNGENPSYRIFTIDGNYPGSYRAIRDIETYYFNLTEANALPCNKPNWTRAYNTKEKYGMNGLNPADWHNLTLNLENNDQIFQEFYRMYTMESDFETKPCFGSCKTEMICGLQSAISHNSSFCNTVKK